jgi:ribonuclease H / adenosylcobalamin/alpha-ribazole phosphatase
VKTTLLLVRHATCERMADRLNGRTCDVPLTQGGQLEAQALGRRLAMLPQAVVYSSVRLRARQTAECIAAPHGVPIQIEPALDEVDFGRWSGMSFAELEKDPAWRGWNEDRAHARPPGGENMAEVLQRVSSLARTAADRHRGASLVFVSHAEVIRAALLHMRHLSFDRYAAMEVPPASVFKAVAA